MVIFIYNQKSFVRRRLHRCRLRHKIRTIKTRPNNTLRFLQHKNSYPSLFGKRFNFFVIRKRRSEHKSVFTTNNTRPNQKKQPHGSARTHFDTGFNNGSIAMHRPTFFCFSSAPNHNRSIKNNQNKLHQTTTTNNPHNLSIKNKLKQTVKTNTTNYLINRKINHPNNHDKQSQQTTTTYNQPQ